MDLLLGRVPDVEHRATTTDDGAMVPEPGVVPPTRSDVPFDHDQALRIGAVYRAVQILGTAAMQLTLDAWRGPELLDPKPALIRKPEVNTHLSATLEATVNSMALSGSAYWKVTRNARGEATTVEVLSPWDCQEDTTKRELSWSGRKAPLKADEYRHLRLMALPGRSRGLGPIQAARVELTGARDLTSFAGEWFTSGDVPTGILKTDQVLSPDDARQYEQAWQARPAHTAAVLGQGLDYKPILLSPKDAQFLEVQQFTVTGIARLFGIPAHLLLAAIEGSSMTYTNVAQADLTFVRWTLMRYLREIEEAFTSLLPGISTARFNLDALLRADTKTRYEAHAVALGAGFLTDDEVRAMEGLPPLTDAQRARQRPAPAPAPTVEETP